MQLIAGNWKMNGRAGQAAAVAQTLAGGVAGLACELLVCPPATLIATMAGVLEGTEVRLGGQNCHAESDGAYTGGISAEMLAELGCRYVILGHSERRAMLREDDALVRRKVGAALRAGLRPIVCVGETEAEREGGRAEAVVGAQLAGSLPDGFEGDVAYEPVWAIGTGRAATQADIAAMHGFIRGRLASADTRILYGGSVKADNAAQVLAVPQVGGALVGGASLAADSFLAIARKARVLF